MSPAAQRDAIRKASRDVRRLRVDLVDAERKAGELLAGEDAADLASAHVEAVRMLLRAALDTHHDLTEELLAERCSIHGDIALAIDRQPIIVACPECCHIHRRVIARVA